MGQACSAVPRGEFDAELDVDHPRGAGKARSYVQARGALDDREEAEAALAAAAAAFAAAAAAVAAADSTDDVAEANSHGVEAEAGLADTEPSADLSAARLHAMPLTAESQPGERVGSGTVSDARSTALESSGPAALGIPVAGAAREAPSEPRASEAAHKGAQGSFCVLPEQPAVAVPLPPVAVSGLGRVVVAEDSENTEEEDEDDSRSLPLPSTGFVSTRSDGASPSVRKNSNPSILQNPASHEHLDQEGEGNEPAEPAAVMAQSLLRRVYNRTTHVSTEPAALPEVTAVCEV